MPLIYYIFRPCLNALHRQIMNLQNSPSSMDNYIHLEQNHVLTSSNYIAL